MRYVMRIEELRQPERIWAVPAAIIGWITGLAAAWAGLSLLWWGAPLLSTLLAWSMLRDAAALRQIVRSGRVWVYEGQVTALSRERVTLRCGDGQIELALTRPLPLQRNGYYRLYLERTAGGSLLLGYDKAAAKSGRHAACACVV